MKKITALTTTFLVSLLLAQSEPSPAQEAIGIFDEHADVGQVKLAGSASYDADSQSYTLTGGGTNMWFDRDQFHFAWKKMSGDFLLRANVSFVGEGVDPHRKMGWIIRSSLDTSSAYVDVAVHGDGLTSLQYRRSTGDSTYQVESPLTGPDVIQLERKGANYIMSVAHSGEPFVASELRDLDLGAEVYVGLFVCSHNPEVTEKGVFTNVRIVAPAKDDFVPYRDYIGSNLEIMDVETGLRKIIYQSPESIQAPNWRPDGKQLIYNSNGILYNFDLVTNTPSVLNTDFATRNNNDHVLSFDGKMLGISHHSSEHDNQSIVYTLPATGGKPKLVTPTGPSYLHGWSPDKKFLIYTGGRDGIFDIYRIPAEGGEEINLTQKTTLDDGSEYSPDGQHIYFNSARTGTMEIWRMGPDGRNPEQITDDEYNNWFPHISPDGKQIVFLSYPKEVDAADHPWYKHIYLRLMPMEGGEPKVIAYVYGGQGTINVPSWSPDSKKVAFVSNTGMKLPEAASMAE